jgi:rhamnosyltransferase
VIIPVRNGGVRWREAADALRSAVTDVSQVAVVDSASSDGSDQVALERGFELLRIPVESFNHGRTRQEAVERFCSGRRIVIFQTQDAVIENASSLAWLLRQFESPDVGAAYGRQLPHHGARPFEAHAALFNYQPESDIRSLADADRLGIKTAFLSNSFAAYRIEALRQAGGFPDHLILGEDAYAAMRMLMAGWRVSYCAEARVRHSHDYTIRQEMQRYFDFGVMHAQIPELLRTFGAPEGEGLRFVLSELSYIGRVAPLQLPQVPLRNVLKYFGYRLGRGFARLPAAWRSHLSMTKGYWSTPAGAAAVSSHGRAV